MKISPLPFNDPMVVATIDGSKRQTRRPLLTQPSSLPTLNTENGYVASWIVDDGSKQTCVYPFGGTGDRLWVRESHWLDIRNKGLGENQEVFYNSTPNIARLHDGQMIFARSSFMRERNSLWGLQMELGPKLTPEESLSNLKANKFWKKRPPMFMFRWSSRLTLEIARVRLERLQDITEEDADAEGALSWALGALGPGMSLSGTARDYFAMLWQIAYGAEAWDANPWVWTTDYEVIEFKQPKVF